MSIIRNGGRLAPTDNWAFAQILPQLFYPNSCRLVLVFQKKSCNIARLFIKNYHFSIRLLSRLLFCGRTAGLRSLSLLAELLVEKLQELVRFIILLDLQDFPIRILADLPRNMQLNKLLGQAGILNANFDQVRSLF